MPDDIDFEGERATFQSGLRLTCPDCGAEIRVVIATPQKHANQSFRCCGKDMVPETPAER